MAKIDLTLSEFHLLLDHYFLSKGKKNKFTIEGKNLLYKYLDKDCDLDMIWTIEEIAKEYTELSLIEFAEVFGVEKDKEVIEDYIYQESSYLIGFTIDNTVVFQDVIVP